MAGVAFEGRPLSNARATLSAWRVTVKIDLISRHLSIRGNPVRLRKSLALESGAEAPPAHQVEPGAQGAFQSSFWRSIMCETPIAIPRVSPNTSI